MLPLIISVNRLLCLIYKLGYQEYACTGKTSLHVGLVLSAAEAHTESWNNPVDKEEQLCMLYNSISTNFWRSS
jgi:hypothetical protein